MLAPHDGEDSELGEIRVTPENALDALKFFRRQAVLRHDFRSDGGLIVAGHSARHVSVALSACKIRLASAAWDITGKTGGADHRAVAWRGNPSRRTGE